MPGTYDWTGITPIKPHSHVKIVRRNHHCYGWTGSVVRVVHPRVWVALADGRIVSAGHRSIEVLVPKASAR